MDQSSQIIIARAIKGDERAVRWCLQNVSRPAHSREIVSGILTAAQASVIRFEKLREEMSKRILPAMLRGTWEHDGTSMLDVEIAGRHVYCSLPLEESVDLSALGTGDEVAVASIEGGPTVLVRSMNRPFATTGSYGMVVDTRRRDDGVLELEIDDGHETFTCIASAAVSRAVEAGEIDALGGFPITAVHKHGIAWRLLQRKGKAEQSTADLDEVTLADFAGYAALRARVTRSVAIQVLSLEPPVLTDAVGLPPSLTNPPFRGILATGPPGTGKTYLHLAVIGSLRAEIGAPKARAKLAALRLWAATHPGERLNELAGRPEVSEALDVLQKALEDQYRGIRSFGVQVATPDVRGLGEPRALGGRLLEGYGIPIGRAARKLRDLEEIVERGRSDFMVLLMQKEDYIQSLVGHGINFLAAQAKRAQNHDDLSIMVIPESETLFARRGHHSRFYTDEITSKFLEILDGPVACRNLFVLADGNRRDMLDCAFAGRRLESLHFEGLAHDDREPVIRAILSRNGVEAERVETLTQALLDLIYASTRPLCEVVLADESRVPLTVDHVLTPAVIQNVVRTANGEALARGALAAEEKDLEVAWAREREGQARRFSTEEVVEILGLDRGKASRVLEVVRG